MGKFDSVSGALTWHTFFGSAGCEVPRDLTMDNSGNLVVVGVGGTTFGTPVRPHMGGNEAFVVSMNSGTGTVNWNTFLGGSGSETAFYADTDSAGNVYVTGESNATWGSPVLAYGSGVDIFVAKLGSAVAHTNPDPIAVTGARSDSSTGARSGCGKGERSARGCGMDTAIRNEQ